LEREVKAVSEEREGFEAKMAEAGDGEGVMRIGRRCYVSNLAWRTSEWALYFV
jgi:hypothetical protein